MFGWGELVDWWIAPKSAPPTALAPTLAAYFLGGKVAPEQIAALFFDLARRDHFKIIQIGNDVALAQTPQSMQGLLPMEHMFLLKVFGHRTTVYLEQLAPSLQALPQALEHLVIQDCKEAGRYWEMRREWRAFHRYLLVDDMYHAPKEFGAYFAYAVAFDCVAAWSQNCNTELFGAKPIWYVTSDVPNYQGQLVALAQKITQLLAGEEGDVLKSAQGIRRPLSWALEA